MISVIFTLCLFHTQAGIPISSQLLSDLLESLDQDSNDLIDYREFVHGMRDFRLDERKKVTVALSEYQPEGIT